MDVHKEAGSKKSHNKYKKNENEHVQINVTRCFSLQKNQALNRAKKTSRKAATRQNKKQAAEQKQWTVCKTNKKKNACTRSHSNRESDAGNNLHKNKKNSNVCNWLQKTIKNSIKSLQKIRQARKYIYNSKKQTNKQESKHKHAPDGWHYMPENAETKQQQQMATLIWRLQRQKKKD